MPITEMNGDFLKVPPAILITGDTGTGKSTAVAEAFHDYKWLVSNPKQLGPIQARIAKQTEQTPEAERVSWTGSAALFVPEFDSDQSLKKHSAREPFREWINKYVSACKAGKVKYRGLVIDELSTLLDWIFQDVAQIHGRTGRGPFDAVAEIKEIAMRLTQLPQETGKGVVFISHWQDKKFDERPDVATRGEMRYPAGPTFPVGTMIRPFCREMDLVWRLVCRDSMSGRIRFFETQPKEDTVLKTKRFGLPPEVPLDGFRRLIREELGYDV
jgi:hypothetical protein